MRRIISVIAAAAMLLLLVGCTGEPISLAELPDPADTVDLFFACLEQGDYESADELVYNYETLGFPEKPTGDVLLDSVFRAINDTRSYEITELAEVSGRDARISFKVTSLDMRIVSEALTTNVTEAIADYMYDGKTFETEDSVLPVVSAELASLLNSDAFPSLLTTSEFTVYLRYSESTWRIIMTDELYSALIGYMV